MKPFVKWAGGKKQILDPILDKIKKSINRYNRNDFTFIEPFVGGGVVFLSLEHQNTIINDLNNELITAYRVIRDRPLPLMNKLDSMYEEYSKDKENYYYKIRVADRDKDYPLLSDLDIASRMIFLNKTCFNGLYRVNSEGYFNVPKGRNNLLGFYERNNILAISEYLNRIPQENIMCGSYKKAMKKAKVGDVVYVDPPYDYRENDGFTKYQKEGFSFEDLKELKNECDDCLERGAYIIMSNNDTEKVRATFSGDKKHDYSFYVIEKIDTKRLINCKADLRNTGKEIIIWGIPIQFPNVADVKTLIRYIRVRDGNIIKDNELLGERFNVSQTCVGRIISTLRYFDIIDSSKDFTEKGLKIRKCRKEEINKNIKEIILDKEIFNNIYRHDIVNTSLKYSKSEIADIILSDAENNNEAYARADIIRKIVDWCICN